MDTRIENIWFWHRVPGVPPIQVDIWYKATDLTDEDRALLGRLHEAGSISDLVWNADYNNTPGEASWLLHANPEGAAALHEHGLAMWLHAAREPVTQ